MKKCPKCNEIFTDFAGVYPDTCPKCRIDLDTGLKIDAESKRVKSKKGKKIRIYGWISKSFIIITIWLALDHLIRYLLKNSRFDSVCTVSFFLDILLSPYLWVALVLRWRIGVNKKRLNEATRQE